MKRVLLLVTLVAALLAGCDSGESTPAPRADKGPCSRALEGGLRTWARAGFSGSIVISKRGKPVCEAAYGMADRDSGRPNTPRTVYSIGSITKAFTAAAVAQLAADGKLSLSDRAGELLPTLRGPVADATVEQLLLHTSGLKGTHAQDHTPLTREQAIAAIGALEQAFTPGSDFLYSNAGYTLLALIVEQVSGTSYRHYLASHVLRGGGFWDGRPAAPGPRARGYLEDGTAGEAGDFRGPFWAVDGNGGLAMTMPQLAAWTHALFTGEIVSPQALRTITTPGVRTGKGQSEAPGWVAYDRAVFGEPVYASAGGGGDVGHNAIVAWLPRSQTAIAVASNTPELSAERLLAAIGPALAAGKPLPAPKGATTRLDPAELERYAGTYELAGGGSFEVGARDGRLEVTADGVHAVEALFPLPRGVDAAAHEQLVRDLLAGKSEEGRKERAGIEKSLGPIDAVDIDGSVVDDGELRTYVTVHSGAKTLRLWYVLNEEGGVEAAQGPTEPPALSMLGAGRDTFRPDDPTGAGAQVTVTFGRGTMTITRPGGRYKAKACASCS
jgi:CubicO group peptidase (beta-lactamase class C family)